MVNRKPQSEIQCSQFEALLAEALEGLLPAETMAAFDAHSQNCSLCGPMFTEAQEGMLLLRGMEELEPPKNLMHNILAATSMAASSKEQATRNRAGWLQRLWAPARPLLARVAQPRFVSSFAMAFFSLSLLLSLAGVRIKDLANLDLRPESLRKAVVLQFTQVEASVVKYYENMRWVYAIQTRVRELRKAAVPPENDQKPKEQQKRDKNPNNDTSGRPEQHEDYSQGRTDSVIAYTKSRNEGALL
jgi:predicted anti-sigma-YlaC factor YlaD